MRRATSHPTILLAAARNLGQQVRALAAGGRRECAIAGYHLSLWRQDDQHRLVIAHTDRPPSPVEIAAIGEAVGAPADCEPVRTVCMVTYQDGARRLPAYVLAWREIDRRLNP